MDLASDNNTVPEDVQPGSARSQGGLDLVGQSLLDCMFHPFCHRLVYIYTYTCSRHTVYKYYIRGACKNDSHFFLTLSFLVSDANDIDTKEEGEEKDEDALSFPIHL